MAMTPSQPWRSSHRASSTVVAELRIFAPQALTLATSSDFSFAQTVANLDFGRIFVRTNDTHSLGFGIEGRHERYETGAGDPASYAAMPRV